MLSTNPIVEPPVTALSMKDVAHDVGVTQFPSVRPASGRPGEVFRLIASMRGARMRSVQD